METAKSLIGVPDAGLPFAQVLVHPKVNDFDFIDRLLAQELVERLQRVIVGSCGIRLRGALFRPGHDAAMSRRIISRMWSAFSVLVIAGIDWQIGEEMQELFLWTTQPITMDWRDGEEDLSTQLRPILRRN
jgi:hypothetical protein